MAEDITPKHLRCHIVASCPSVHVLDDRRLIVVGKVGHPFVAKHKLPIKVGQDETAVIIEPDLLSDLPELTRLREENEKLREALGCQADRIAKGDPVSREGALQSGPEGKQVGLTPEEYSEFWGLRKRAAQCEWAAEELECLHMTLDDRGVPRSDDAGTFSLVGRVNAYAAALRERDQSPKGGDFAEGSVHAGPVPAGNSPEVSAAGGEAGLTHKSPSDPHRELRKAGKILPDGFR